MSDIELFPGIDTSYWKTKDRDWMAQRDAEWPRIERMFDLIYKSRKGLTAIKRYYLKGQMPNWEALRDWDNDGRHVDLFVFIWLHPSTDPEILIPLRNAYVRSPAIVLEDVKKGINSFIHAGTVGAIYKFDDCAKGPQMPYTGGRNEVLFDILMGNPCDESVEIQGHSTFGRKSIFHFRKAYLDDLNDMLGWLALKKLCPVNEDFLLQYDRPLEWWYQSCLREGGGSHYVFTPDSKDQMIRVMYAALHRIHTFDTEAEGETCRTRFVRKMRRMLDEREFFPSFKQAWLDVRAGRIRVDENDEFGCPLISRVQE